jgi:hypothetical protein
MFNTLFWLDPKDLPSMTAFTSDLNTTLEVGVFLTGVYGYVVNDV